MTQTHYCIKCGLKEGHPGIIINDKGLCNICRMDLPKVVTANYKKIASAYQSYEKSVPRGGDKYDCILMLSGGKDSIHMLDRLVSEGKRKVLAYTFDVPFESREAINNIEKLKDKIKVDYFLDSNEIKYKKLMRYVFENLKEKKTGNYLDEKTPCMLCARFFTMSAFFYAYKNDIPFILNCMDPVQMLTFSLDLEVIIKEYLDWFGREYCEDIFSYNIEELLHKKEDELPKIVYPYFPEKTTYNKDKIIEGLKKKGLYNSTPMRTHCTLFGLLNYFSIKNYDCIYYKLDYSAMARSGMISNEVVLKHEKEMKELIMNIVNNQQISKEQKERFIESWKAIGFDGDPSYLYDLVSFIKKGAAELNLTLEA